MESKRKYFVKLAYDRGYRVVNGDVISPYGITRALTLHHDSKSGYGRYRFNIRNEDGVSYPVNVHQLVAYQKFGDVSFDPNVVVRHLDGNSLNNLEENIEIGTSFQNANDVPPETRLFYSINASTKLRKFTDDEMNVIRKERAEGATYQELMYTFNISSKGTLHHILNNKYKTKV